MNHLIPNLRAEHDRPPKAGDLYLHKDGDAIYLCCEVPTDGGSALRLFDVTDGLLWCSRDIFGGTADEFRRLQPKESITLRVRA